MSKENDPRFVRCVNVHKDTYGYFLKEDAFNPSWQRSSGFRPIIMPDAPPTPLILETAPTPEAKPQANVRSQSNS